MLNELDKELEARGLDFVRYADDLIIMVGSRQAADRVMKSVTRFVEVRLGLKAVLFDFSFEILMDEALVNLFPGYHVWIPMDSRVLLIHEANNPNRLLNELINGTGAYDHARTLPMAIFYLLVIACLYAKIRKRSATP